jgi:hypothetical protein
MKKFIKVILAFLMIVVTGCSLLGGSNDAKAKEGWESIQGRKGETYYESCEYYHVYNISKVVGKIYENNNVFDGRVFYYAYNETTNVGDYYKYDTKTKRLDEIGWDEFYFVERNGSDPEVAHHGYLGKDAEEQK